MPESTSPRHQQIADYLRTLVASSTPGDRLPSDADLCERFQVSRMTARQAVHTLLAEGLLYRRRGHGTFVAEPPVGRLLGSPLSFSESMRARGRVPSSRMLVAGLTAPRAADVATLHLEDGVDVVLVERVRLADGIPMAIERVVLVPALSAVLRQDLGSASLHAEMDRLGRSPSTAHASVSARRADARERRLLELEPAGVLLCERRVIHDQSGVPIEHTETRYAAERYVFEAVVHRNGSAGV